MLRTRAMKFVAPVLACLLVACGGAATSTVTPATSASESASPDLKAPGDAKIGDRTRCPVSGEEFVVRDDSPHTEYQGKTYYFCCPHCVQKFDADPTKYLTKPST
jgi:YHS domain-containing protein